MLLTSVEQRTAKYDRQQYSVNYISGTVGLGSNTAKSYRRPAGLIGQTRQRPPYLKGSPNAHSVLAEKSD